MPFQLESYPALMTMGSVVFGTAKWSSSTGLPSLASSRRTKNSFKRIALPA